MAWVSSMAPLQFMSGPEKKIVYLQQNVTLSNFDCIFTFMCEPCFLESAVQ